MKTWVRFVVAFGFCFLTLQVSAEDSDALLVRSSAETVGRAVSQMMLATAPQADRIRRQLVKAARVGPDGEGKVLVSALVSDANKGSNLMPTGVFSLSANQRATRISEQFGFYVYVPDPGHRARLVAGGSIRYLVIDPVWLDEGEIVGELEAIDLMTGARAKVSANTPPKDIVAVVSCEAAGPMLAALSVASEPGIMGVEADAATLADSVQINCMFLVDPREPWFRGKPDIYGYVLSTEAPEVARYLWLTWVDATQVCYDLTDRPGHLVWWPKDQDVALYFAESDGFPFHTMALCIGQVCAEVSVNDKDDLLFQAQLDRRDFQPGDYCCHQGLICHGQIAQMSSAAMDLTVVLPD